MHDQTIYRGFLIEVTGDEPGFKATIKNATNDVVGSLTGIHLGNLVTKAKRKVDRSISKKQQEPEYGMDTAQRVKVR